ncbi:MAG: septum site-determining protein MinC [Betaproteobacteria bacterium]
MTVQSADASSGTAPATFELKSAQLTLVTLVVKTKHLDQLAVDLEARFGPQGESPDFFDTDGLVIDFAPVQLVFPDANWDRLCAAFKRCRLVPIAVRGLDASGMLLAKQLGLLEAAAEIRRNLASNAKAAQTTAFMPSASATAPVTQVKPHAPAPRDASVPTMVVNKPLRSGQKVYARGGDLVVLAMVNRGAEVIADGNIHVYAPLRGKAMAGARGNASARIFSLCLEPELVSIAGVYRTTEKELAGDVLGKPAQVRLSDDGKEKIIIEALQS